jgi:single-stranded DNA-binding protein
VNPPLNRKRVAGNPPPSTRAPVLDPTCESAGLRCPALLTYIEGRLRIREFEAKDNGGKRQRAEIIANRVQFSARGQRRPRRLRKSRAISRPMTRRFSGYLQDARAEKRGHFPPPRAVS